MWVAPCLLVQGVFTCFTDLVVTSDPAKAQVQLAFTVNKTLDISCSALPSTPQIQLKTGKLTFTTTPGWNFNVNGPKSITLSCPDMNNAITDCIPAISSMSSAEFIVASTTSGSAFQYSAVVPTIIASRFDYNNCWADIDILQSVYEDDGAMDINVKPLYCDIPTTAKLYAIFRISEVETVTFPLEPQSTSVDGYIPLTLEYIHTKAQTFKINCSTISSSPASKQKMTTAECTRIFRTFISYPYHLARLGASFSFTNSSSTGGVVVMQPSTNIRDNSTALCFSTAYMRLYRDKICMELGAPTAESSGCSLAGDVKSTYLYFSLSDNVDPFYASVKCYYTRLDPDFTFNTSVRNRYWYTCKDKTCKDTFSSIIDYRNASIAKYGVYMTNLAGQEVKRLLFTTYPPNVTCFADMYAEVMDGSLCIHATLPLNEDYCNILQLPSTTTFKVKLWYTAGLGIESADVSLAGEFKYVGVFASSLCFTCSNHWVPNDKYFNGKYCSSQLSFVKSQYKKSHSYITVEIDDILEVPDNIYFLDNRSLLITSLVLALISVIVTVTIVTLEFLQICKKKGRAK
ncbi:Hypothetical protein GLP15_3676 [Giardia lamblia P15]|uniref:Uncharacterized protein n=1 Tax=Giardia intestinalis (strain P15) TaxID=658858 RepID=E1EYT7_GIAIA|nr:Hypothetical protein GLP15_3676 [Giardia lamblia P15]